MISVSVTEVSQVAEARRVCVDFCQRHGFDSAAAGRVALVATELATNLVKHGGGGEIITGPYEDDHGAVGVEIISVDKGPGITNLESSLSDGVSTAGTAGYGLGAIKRQSQGFEVFSQVGRGTVVVSKVLAKNDYFEKSGRTSAPLLGCISVPLRGEVVSGDGWAARFDGGGHTLMLIDGLGHGPDAAKVATESLHLFNKYWRAEPAEVIRCLHAGLRSTRGGAVAVARVEPSAKRVLYSGVGNISGAICASGGQMRRMMSYNGTIGHNARHIQQLEYPLERPEDSMIVMHSDGIATSWSVAAYPGLIGRPPILLAAALYRDFSRGRDDATVLALKGGMQ